MSARTITLIDEHARMAMVARNGQTWSVLCLVVDDPCQRIEGFGNRGVGILAAERHLLWHSWGKPVCPDCGARLLQKHQKRCRTGTCEVAR